MTDTSYRIVIIFMWMVTISILLLIWYDYNGRPAIPTTQAREILEPCYGYEGSLDGGRTLGGSCEAPPWELD